MSPEWYYPNGIPVFRFGRFSNAETFFPKDIQTFEERLSEILAIKRPELPFKPGEILILGSLMIPYIKIEKTFEISRNLTRNGFKDTGNWDISSKHDPSSWWANSLCFDVVGLPPYYEENSQSVYLERQLGYNRLFVRPNYTWVSPK